MGTSWCDFLNRAPVEILGKRGLNATPTSRGILAMVEDRR